MAVQPDGYVTLRGVGDVYVAGLTVPEITETLRTAYRKILQNPAIAIVLKDFEKPYFTISGQVGRPGKYELRGDTTVTEAIAIAGGFNSSAKHSQVVLFRRVSRDLYEAKLINVKQMLKNRDLSEDAHLKPGDTLRLTIFRNDKLREFTLRAEAPNIPEYKVTKVDTPTELQKQIFESWLGSPWSAR